MFYRIRPRTKHIARRLGIHIRPSHKPEKKIDVLLPHHTISIGQRGSMDYPQWLERDKEKAEIHRKRYEMRHERDRHKKDTAGWYADQLLWK
jgi:hypothetical protein